MAEQLDQLYYTWSTVGFGDIPGYRLRAASRGVASINDERYSRIKPYLTYFLPTGTDPYKAITANSPFCLVYARAGNEYIIAQKVYKGKDDYQRPNVYFVHLVAGLPESFVINGQSQQFVARDAIDLWTSAFWKTDDGEVKDVMSLSEPLLQDLLAQRNTQFERNFLKMQDFVNNYLPLVIQAYLELGDEQKLYIAGTADQVALLIWGLAHSLPRTMQRNMTFSTYEQDVLKASVRIVGTCKPQPGMILQGYIMPPQLLPPECYSKGQVIDCYTGKHSDLRHVSEKYVVYSQFMTQCLLRGAKAKREKILEKAEKKGIKNSILLRSFIPTIPDITVEPHTPNDVLGYFEEEMIDYLQETGLQLDIIKFAIADHTWWNGRVVPAIKRLYRSDIVVASLCAFGIQIANQLCEAYLRQDTNESNFLQSALDSIAPPNLDNRPSVQLLRRFAETHGFQPDKWFTWEERSLFLVRWISCQLDYKWIDVLLPWLQLQNWDEFLALLKIEQLPERWYQLAFMEMLTRTNGLPPPKQVIKLFNKPTYYPFFMGALVHMVEQRRGLQGVLNCFNALVQSNFKDLVLVLETLLAKGTLKPKEVDTLFNAAQLNPKEKLQLLENNYQQLVPSGSQEKVPHVVVEIIDEYLEKLTRDKLTNTTTLATLTYLYEQQSKLPQPTATKLTHWIVSISIYGQEGVPPVALSPNYVKTLGAAIQYFELQNDKNYRAQLIYMLITRIAYNSDTHKAHTDLCCVLDNLSPLLGKRDELFRELATFLGESLTNQNPYTIVVPYVEEALARAGTMKKDNDKEKFLVPLFKVLLQRVDKKMFEMIGKYISFPDHMRQDWELYAEKSRPRRVPLQANGMQVLGAVGDMAKGVVEIGKERLHPSTQPSQGQGVPTTNGNPGNASSNGNQFEQPFEQQSSEQGMSPTMDGFPNGNQSYGPDMLEARIHNGQQAQPSATESPTYPQTGDSAAQGQGGSTPPSSNPPFIPLQQQSFVPENSQFASFQQQRGQPEPQSIVNGVQIYPEQITRLFKLKDIYIRLRLDELDDLFGRVKKKNGPLDWILDEQDELREHTTKEYTLRVLENDVLITEALRLYSQQANTSSNASSVPVALYNEMYAATLKQVKKQQEYRQVLGNVYSDNDMQEVLSIFLRYRTLAALFRNQGRDIPMRDWLQQQRSRVDVGIQRNEFMPLPQIE